MSPTAKAPFELNALARERLGAGVHLYLACGSSDDSVDAPTWTRTRLDQAFIDRLLRVQAACAELDLSFSSARGGPDEYDQACSEISSWSVRVNEQEFWLFGQARHGSVSSRDVPFKNLCVALGEPAVPVSAAPGDQGFVWYGGALVYEPELSALEDFVSLLEDERPDLAAREREIEMAVVLAARKDTDNPGAAVAPARRAPTL